MTSDINATLATRLEWIDSAKGDVIALATDYADGTRIPAHRHGRAQMLFPFRGTVMISTGQGRWMVPPDHAMWIPTGVEHAVEMLGMVQMRSVYVAPDASAGLPDDLRVLAVNGLMRSLVVEAVQTRTMDADARAHAVMQLMLLEMARLEPRPFALPFPADPRLMKLCRAFIAKPNAEAPIDEWADRAGMSRRSFTRAFQRETGLSLSVWRRQAVLLAALPLLARGKTVTEVALGLGYESAPAFTTMFRRMLGVAPRTYLRQGGRTQMFASQSPEAIEGPKPAQE